MPDKLTLWTANHRGAAPRADSRAMWRPTDESPDVRALAVAQAGVVTRDQLRALGVDRHDIRDHVGARRWRIAGRVVVLHRGEMTPEQRHWAAVLHAGQGAALASLTAAALHGLTGWESEQVHVVVARGVRVHPLPWMRIHISRRFRPEDVHPTRVPSQCRVERAVVDAATWKPNPRLACALLCSAVQQQLVSPQSLRSVIDNAGFIAHRKQLLAVLTDIEGGSDALSEVDLVRLCRRAGLPRPEQQVRRRDSSGRWRYLDARLVRPDGRVLLIEVDGAVHLDTRRWWDDQSRSNDVVTADDAMILRFPSVVLRSDPDRVAEQLRAAYFGPVRHSGRISARYA